jgi:hypothetical protein
VRTAHSLADVPWLDRSRRAHAAWHLRVGALVVGCVVAALAVDAGLTTPGTVLAATGGLLLAGAGLLVGATYGRIVGALASALAVGHEEHWLAARVAAGEGRPRHLAAELEAFAFRQPA